MYRIMGQFLVFLWFFSVFVHLVPRLSLFIHIPQKNILFLSSVSLQLGSFTRLNTRVGKLRRWWAQRCQNYPRAGKSSARTPQAASRLFPFPRCSHTFTRLSHVLSFPICGPLLSYYLTFQRLLDFHLSFPFSTGLIFSLFPFSANFALTFLYYSYSMFSGSNFRVWKVQCYRVFLSVTSTSHTRLFLTLCTLLVVTLSCLAMSVSNQSLNS